MWDNTTFDRNMYYFPAAGPGPVSQQQRFKWRSNATNPAALDFSKWQHEGNDVHGAVEALRDGVVPAACYSSAWS
jgi:hypothetical protein